MGPHIPDAFADDRPNLLLLDVEVDRRRTDVEIRDGIVAAIGSAADTSGDEHLVVEANGGALLPGLHDHHLHLLATAAARRSVSCAPPRSREEVTAALRSTEPRAGWIRGIGYHESSMGELDRYALDGIRSDVPVRIQHRSGMLWVVNSAAVRVLGLNASALDGIERGPGGHASGRLWRLDGWLRDRLPSDGVPDLRAVSDELAAYGVTGVTDASPALSTESTALLSGDAVRQRTLLLGACAAHPLAGPCKILVDDLDLPSLDDLAATIAQTRPRGVAVHCVSRVALLLVIAALDSAGAQAGDRIEHASVAPPHAAEQLARLGVTVVTQPSFIALRGDDYLAAVDTDDIDWLWPFASLRAAGVQVACGSDAPYGDLDPWRSIRSAVDRLSPSGRQVAPGQRVPSATAFEAFLTAPDRPGGPPRSLGIGTAADLLLLDRGIDDQLAAPTSDAVVMTLIDGAVAYRRH